MNYSALISGSIFFTKQIYELMYNFSVSSLIK